jgi:hypothetical protein
MESCRTAERPMLNDTHRARSSSRVARLMLYTHKIALGLVSGGCRQNKNCEFSLLGCFAGAVPGVDIDSEYGSFIS